MLYKRSDNKIQVLSDNASGSIDPVVPESTVSQAIREEEKSAISE